MDPADEEAFQILRTDPIERLRINDH
jgi:hypothetical protein